MWEDLIDMKIEHLLEVGKRTTDKDLVEMIICNRITHYLEGPDKPGSAICSKNFTLLADDILKWHESKK